ncbi:MAG: DUF3108 domain-containing protein [Caulobacterales bacterium]
MRALFAGILFGFIAVAPAAADRFSLDYKASALAVLSLGDVTIDFDVTATHYSAEAHLQSRGLLSLFERTRLIARAEGDIENGAVSWRRYDLDHHYSRKHRVIAMTHEGSSVEARIEPNYRLWGEPPASEAQKLASRDPLSSLVAMAVDVQRERTCNRDYPTFDGRFHYLLQLRDARRDVVDAGGYDGPALHCTMRYVPVAGFEANDGGKRRVPEGDVWFALVDGASMAPPVRIQLPLPVGRAHIALSRWSRPEVSIDTANTP